MLILLFSYGELGSVIIHQTLFGIFPATSFDPTVIQPLTVNEFILLVLVPEVATRLIMEDKGLEGEEGVSKAISIMQASAFYGSSMFPEDAGDGEERKMGVGDRMLMERAKKRRKEIEEEEGDEVEVEEESVYKKTASESRSARAARRANGPSKEAKTEVAAPASSMPSQTSQPKPRPRPKPVVKTESNMSLCSDTNDPSPLTPVPSSRSSKPSKGSTAKPSRRSGRSHLVKVDSDMEVETDRTADGSEGSESEVESKSGVLDSRRAPRSLRRSPSASEWSRHVPDPTTKPKRRPKAVRSTSTGNKDYLSISESDADMRSDFSLRANVGRSKQGQGLKTPVASRRAGVRGGNGGGAGFGAAQAPVNTATMDGDETPRPSRKGDPVNASSNGDTPPLMRARRMKEERQKESEGWEKNFRGDLYGSSSKVEEYDWLFSD